MDQTDWCEDNDFALAVALSKQDSPESKNSKDPTVSIVDDYWEINDPNPDIRALFLQYNQSYFWGKLLSVEVRWSPKMTLCAGLCIYQKKAGYCSIRLSQPLLKFRPRRDLVQTLLHEMIHAYLFVIHDNRDHDAHGPCFLEHMHRINSATGANITVYHNFHDEVNVYRQHWWRCNGPCKDRSPFFGYVKRAMNRAPSKNDPWWSDHQQSCGGTFIKVKEPEGYGEKGKKRKKLDKDNDNQTKITDFHHAKKVNDNIDRAQGTSISDGSRSINSEKSVDNDNQNSSISYATIPFSGKGYVLGSNDDKSSTANYRFPALMADELRYVKCPICHRTDIRHSIINEHLDNCLVLKEN
ncbi:uncharacterized protein TRIADDRAFT_30208 [Trichoplax adhaerens]|uniref:Protein with SprT-like domain at the N terminus n=1 Tax=Trichoplax adhaerens TaxID=10228 RepID=B3S6M2_TRIAD|nr:hypothetical protein TRIADDRAFT_30208 [Trichoplax adhaerens]EDV21783.1 hypothetical protein TRIADDRAFT_30208 [Trichoplax adhaerens]|eukprot:XP_002115931.1 hypothetical protein TRIADDRAFT_30208 [Trichoplax adhaerens]